MYPYIQIMNLRHNELKIENHYNEYIETTIITQVSYQST